MRFWAIEPRPGELLVDEAVVGEAVSRILGITTVEALFLFTSRTSLDAFMEGFLPDDDESTRSRQELEAAFNREVETMAGTSAEGGALRFPIFDVQSLVEVMEGVSVDVRYVALDPDTLRQQVWSVEQFGTHLLGLLGRA